VNLYLVTLADGTTAKVAGENYNVDQFGNTVASWSAARFVDIALINPSASPAETSASVSYQPLITGSDPRVPGTWEAGNTTFTGGA
jgi:hypothetical protein